MLLQTVGLFRSLPVQVLVPVALEVKVELFRLLVAQDLATLEVL
jgi:hypothetical protein